MKALFLPFIWTPALSEKKIDDFKHLIQSTKTFFDIITISESRLIKDELPPIDVSLPSSKVEFRLAEASAIGTLIYLRNHL